MDKKIATLLKGDSTALEQQFFVDYNMSFEEMVKAAKYDSVSYKVNQKLTLLGKGKTFFIPKLFLFDLPISSLEVIQEMEKAGCRPSKNEEFVSFDIMLSEDQRN